MPAPPARPTDFVSILEQIWWRLDAALDLEMIRWSAMLGALEAIESGTTAIIDHHESPNAIEGSLSVVADAGAEVGVRVCTAYGVTDRHGPDGARRGLAENERFLREGGRGMVGVHAAFTCSDATLEAAAALGKEFGVGVHIHVAEGLVDADARARLEHLAADDWVLAHGVHLDGDLPGTVVHNPRSNMNNAVGYAHPARRRGPVALGTDGIGADMLEEYRLAFARLREDDLSAEPAQAWGWLEEGCRLFPEAAEDTVVWDSDHADDPWWMAYTTAVRAVDVTIGGEKVLQDGRATRVDADEVRARAAEQATRLFRRL